MTSIPPTVATVVVDSHKLIDTHVGKGDRLQIQDIDNCVLHTTTKIRTMYCICSCRHS